MVVGFVAGVASSALGLGAGTIINPILMGTLENYPPSVYYINSGYFSNHSILNADSICLWYNHLHT
jgi:uncharacterized membrane protein YfcA